MYSEKVMDHFSNPRNVGEIENADGVGQVGNAKCGDIMKIYLKIEDDIIKDVKFETFGCGSAIASSSMATEMIKGKPVSQAMALTNKAVVEALDGLPAHKVHCSVLRRRPSKRLCRTITSVTGSHMTLSSFQIARAAPIAPPKIDPHPRRRRRTDTVFPPPALNTPAAQRKKGATIASRNSRSFYYARK